MIEENKNIENKVLPEKVIQYFESIVGFHPSIIETEYYTLDGLLKTLSNNEIIWSNKYFDGNNTIYQNGLVHIKSSDIFFYFIKRKNEINYKFYYMSKEDSTDSVVFYLNQLKKFKTIS